MVAHGNVSQASSGTPERRDGVLGVRLGNVRIVSHTVLLGRVVRRQAVLSWRLVPKGQAFLDGHRGRGKVPARRVPRATGQRHAARRCHSTYSATATM